jgi:hypothetical protein
MRDERSVRVGRLLWFYCLNFAATGGGGSAGAGGGGGGNGWWELLVGKCVQVFLSLEHQECSE